MIANKDCRSLPTTQGGHRENPYNDWAGWAAARKYLGSEKTGHKFSGSRHRVLGRDLGS
jgi:hypothetical protein